MLAYIEILKVQGSRVREVWLFRIHCASSRKLLLVTNTEIDGDATLANYKSVWSNLSRTLNNSFDRWSYFWSNLDYRKIINDRNVNCISDSVTDVALILFWFTLQRTTCYDAIQQTFVWWRRKTKTILYCFIFSFILNESSMTEELIVRFSYIWLKQSIHISGNKSYQMFRRIEIFHYVNYVVLMSRRAMIEAFIDLHSSLWRIKYE